MRRLAWVMLALGVVGCGRNPEEPASAPAKDAGAAAATTTENMPPAKTQEEVGAAVAKAKLSRATATAATGLGLRAAIGQLQTRIEESLAAGPTSVIWVIDVSKSTERLRAEATPMIAALHASSQRKFEGADCEVGVLAASEQAAWAAEPAAFDETELEAALEGLLTAESHREMLFEAIKTAGEAASEAKRKRRDALIILITDEAGEDGERVDEVLAPLKRFGTPVYVLGSPAPFGRATASSASIEDPQKAATDYDATVMHEGPETIELEVVDLAFAGSEHDFELYDSGFGPFALERLCRASGGRYFALRPSAADGFYGLEMRWPDPAARRFSPERMQAYAPSYGTRGEYETLLESNGAARALVAAAKLPRVATLGAVNMRFDPSNEAQLKRRLDQSQEAAAKIEPPITRLVELLQRGEAERDALPSARWKAGYDLALGRALAAKARVDGYNSMLAGLKRGKRFENASSKMWVLEMSEDAAEAGSAVASIARKAERLLQRVIEEHPETPWAAMAERELETPLGWKWSEE